MTVPDCYGHYFGDKLCAKCAMNGTNATSKRGSGKTCNELTIEWKAVVKEVKQKKRVEARL